MSIYGMPETLYAFKNADTAVATPEFPIFFLCKIISIRYPATNPFIGITPQKLLLSQYIML